MHVFKQVPPPPPPLPSLLKGPKLPVLCEQGGGGGGILRPRHVKPQVNPQNRSSKPRKRTTSQSPTPISISHKNKVLALLYLKHVKPKRQDSKSLKTAKPLSFFLSFFLSEGVRAGAPGRHRPPRIGVVRRFGGRRWCERLRSLPPFS